MPHWEFFCESLLPVSPRFPGQFEKQNLQITKKNLLSHFSIF